MLNQKENIKCKECKSVDLVLMKDNLICRNCGLVQPPSIKYSDILDIRTLIKDKPIQKKVVELFDDENFSYEDIILDYDEDISIDPATNDLLPDIKQVVEYEHRLKYPEIEEKLNQEIKKSQLKKKIKITYSKNNKLKIVIQCEICFTKNVFHQNNIYKNDSGISFYRECKKCGTKFIFNKNRNKYKIIVVLNKTDL